MNPTLKEAAAAALEALTAADLLPERRAALQTALAHDAAEEERVRGLLADVTFPGYRFRVVTVHGAALQVEYDEADVESGVPAVQRGRKWYLSSWATRGEVVQTALKAVLTSHEHRVREHFGWRGARVFGPHFDLEQLGELARAGATEKRPPAAQDAAPEGVAYVPTARLAPPADPAYGPARAAYALCGERYAGAAHDALAALQAGNRRRAAALLVQLERRHADNGPMRVQAALALNHLPTPWVVACRAIEDAGGGPVLRAAAESGDPDVLRVALLARLGNDHPPQAEQHLREAIEAVEREAAG